MDKWRPLDDRLDRKFLVGEVPRLKIEAGRPVENMLFCYVNGQK